MQIVALGIIVALPVILGTAVQGQFLQLTQHSITYIIALTLTHFLPLWTQRHTHTHTHTHTHRVDLVYHFTMQTHTHTHTHTHKRLYLQAQSFCRRHAHGSLRCRCLRRGRWECKRSHHPYGTEDRHSSLSPPSGYTLLLQRNPHSSTYTGLPLEVTHRREMETELTHKYFTTFIGVSHRG